MEKFANLSQLEDRPAPAPAVLSANPQQEGEAGHESMTSVLISPAEPSGRRSRTSKGKREGGLCGRGRPNFYQKLEHEQ